MTVADATLQHTPEVQHAHERKFNVIM